MNLIKKAILYAAVPLMMGSCSIYLPLNNSRDRGNGDSELILRVKNRHNLSDLTDLELMSYWDMKFKNSIYASNLGYDSDGDGIINADDIWKYTYGPFVDSNNNGIVDMFDWQIAGFGNIYIDNYPYRINERWTGLNLNPFWSTEYFNRHSNYFNIHKKHRHQETKYIRPHEVRDNKKRAETYSTQTRSNANRRTKSSRNISTQVKRTLPTRNPNTRSTQFKTPPIKKYKKSTTRTTPARTIKKQTTNRSTIKRSTTSRKQI